MAMAERYFSLLTSDSFRDLSWLVGYLLATGTPLNKQLNLCLLLISLFSCDNYIFRENFRKVDEHLSLFFRENFTKTKESLFGYFS